MTAVAVVDKDTGEVLTPVAFDFAQYVGTLDKSGVQRQQQLAAAYDAACAALVGPNDVQQEGARSFKKKSAFRKLARHFNISCYIAETPTHREIGEHWVVTVRARAVAPWGQVSEDVGSCGSDEQTGRRTITLADAIATASTRAHNRAISNLIAMGEVSAEEIGDRKAYPASRADEGANGPSEKQVAFLTKLLQGDTVTEAERTRTLALIEGKKLTRKQVTQLIEKLLARVEVGDAREPEEASV